MLWLVTFVAVVPVGLLLSHHERLSLRKLSEETAQAEEVVAVEEAQDFEEVVVETQDIKEVENLDLIQRL